MQIGKSAAANRTAHGVALLALTEIMPKTTSPTIAPNADRFRMKS